MEKEEKKQETITKTNDEKTKRVKKPLYKRIIDIIGIVFISLLGVVFVFFLIGNFTSKDNYGVKMIFNHSTLVVLTDSMEPTYKVGGAIFIEKVDAKDVKVGDDLTFYYDSWGVVVTHRVLEVTPPSEGETLYTFKLHGINTSSKQCGSEEAPMDCTDQYQIVTSDKVIGKVVGSSHFVGQVFTFMMEPYGLVLLLLIPGGYLIYVSIDTIVKALKDKEKVEVTDTNSSSRASTSRLDNLSKEEIEKLKTELLNEMLNSKKENKDE